MKQFFIITAAMVSALCNAQSKTKTIDLGKKEGGANDYYYSAFYTFNDNEAKLADNYTWHISFYTKDGDKTDIRVNGFGANTLYYPKTAVENIEDFSIVPDIKDKTYDEYINNLENWGSGGAFSQNADPADSNDFGWGTKQADGSIKGNKVLLLQDRRGKYYKIKIDFKDNARYSISYSIYIRTQGGWQPTKTASIPVNTTGADYTYFNLETDSTVGFLPDADKWDLMLTKYYDKLEVPNPLTGPYFFFFGVLQSPEVSVAKVVENTPLDGVSDADYSTKATSIGHIWNTLDDENYDEDIALTDDKYFFVKNKKGIYRLEFIYLRDMFNGHETSFKTELLKDLSMSVLTAKADRYNIYLAQNPAKNKTLELVFNLKNHSSEPVKISLFSMSGQQVHQEAISSSGTFFTKKLHLPQLPAGTYIVAVQHSGQQKTIKVILQ